MDLSVIVNGVISLFLIILVGILTFAHFKLLAKKVHYQ